MKCMPMTLSGRLVMAPSLVIDIEDVFEANIASVFVTSSRDLKTSVLTLKSSLTASTTMTASLSAPMSVVVLMRPIIARFSSLLSRSLSTLRCRLLSMEVMPRAGFDVVMRDVESRARGHLSDAIAHRARADYTEDFTHIFCSIDFRL